MENSLNLSNNFWEILNTMSNNSNDDISLFGKTVRYIIENAEFRRIQATKNRTVFKGEVNAGYGHTVAREEYLVKITNNEEKESISITSARNSNDYRSMHVLGKQVEFVSSRPRLRNQLRVSFSVAKIPLLGNKIYNVNRTVTEFDSHGELNRVRGE